MTYAELLSAPIRVISQLEVMRGLHERERRWEKLRDAAAAASARTRGRRRG